MTSIRWHFVGACRWSSPHGGDPDGGSPRRPAPPAPEPVTGERREGGTAARACREDRSGDDWALRGGIGGGKWDERFQPGGDGGSAGEPSGAGTATPDRGGGPPRGR